MAEADLTLVLTLLTTTLSVVALSLTINDRLNRDN